MICLCSVILICFGTTTLVDMSIFFTVALFMLFDLYYWRVYTTFMFSISHLQRRSCLYYTSCCVIDPNSSDRVDVVAIIDAITAEFGKSSDEEPPSIRRILCLTEFHRHDRLHPLSF